jgi:hypothetical protein
MALPLPKIDLPVYEMTLPSSQEKIKFRPFTVKEEKILLVAQESGEPEQQIVAVKQIVNNCLLDNDVSEFAMFDLEYVMLSLRAKAVDNKIPFAITDEDTQEKVELELDLDMVKLETNPEHTNRVKINDDYTLFLKYPTIDEFIKIATSDPNDPLTSYFILISCLDKVASEDEVFNFSEYTQEDIDKFMEDVSSDVVRGIEKFFSTMPELRYDVPYTLKDGTEKQFKIQGINAFFS